LFCRDTCYYAKRWHVLGYNCPTCNNSPSANCHSWQNSSPGSNPSVVFYNYRFFNGNEIGRVIIMLFCPYIYFLSNVNIISNYYPPLPSNTQFLLILQLFPTSIRYGERKSIFLLIEVEKLYLLKTSLQTNFLTMWSGIHIIIFKKK